MSEKGEKYFSKKLKLIKESFVLNKVIFTTFFYDLLFYLTVIGGFYLWGSLIKSKFASAGISNVGELMMGSAEQMVKNYEIVRSLLFFYSGSIILFVLFSAIVFGIFKGIIWKDLFKKKYNLKFARNFLFVQLIYFVLGVAVLVFLIKYSQILSVLFVFVWIHFGFLLSFYLTKTEKIKKTLKKTIEKGFLINKFSFPYLIIGLSLYLFNIVFNFIGSKTDNTLLNILFVSLLLIYFSIVRNYMKNVCEKL